MVEIRAIRWTLMAELAWARLYTKCMHKELGAISTIIRKCRQTPAGLEMKESVDKLHAQLRSANRTVGELSDQVRNRPEQSAGDNSCATGSVKRA